MGRISPRHPDEAHRQIVAEHGIITYAEEDSTESYGAGCRETSRLLTPRHLLSPHSRGVLRYRLPVNSPAPQHVAAAAARYVAACALPWMIRQDSAADDAPLADYWPQQNGALPAGGRRRAKPNTRRGEYPPVGAKREKRSGIAVYWYW